MPGCINSFVMLKQDKKVVDIMKNMVFGMFINLKSEHTAWPYQLADTEGFA
jgi:hypothetical protein